MSNTSNSSFEVTLHFICAFPLSGQYGKEVRLLIYLLLLCSSLSRILPWLAAGSLTTIFTYCTVAAIHACAMATFHSSNVLDLDCFVAFHLCVIGLIVSPGAIQQATSLRVRSRLIVFSLFTILLWIGVVSFAASTHGHPQPQPCQNATGPVHIEDTWAVGSCAGHCSQYTLPMRSGQSAQNVVYDTRFFDRVAIAVVCLLTFWVPIGLWNARGISPQEEFQRLFTPLQRKNMSFNEWRDHMKKKKFGLISIIMTSSWLGWCPIVESYLFVLPQSENSDAIGQWGPLVGSLLVVLGAWIKAKLDVQEKKDDMELGHLKGHNWPK